MTDTKQLCVMTVDEFQKHMSAELSALEAKPDNDRMTSFKKSLAAYNAIDNKDENTRIPVELCKSDPDSAVKELAAKFEELEKKIDKILDKKTDKEDDKEKVDADADKDKDDDSKKKEDGDDKEKADADEDKDKADESEKSVAPVDWDSDMGHAVLSASETVAKKKE